MGVRIQIVLGNETITIEVSGGPLAEALSKSATAGDVFRTLATIPDAQDNYAYARQFEVSSFTGDLAWDRAHGAAKDIGLDVTVLDTIATQPVTVEELEPT